MGRYTVSGSGADCKSVASGSGGSTPSLPTITYAECPGGEEAVLKTVGSKGLQVRILCSAPYTPLAQLNRATDF